MRAPRIHHLAGHRVSSTHHAARAGLALLSALVGSLPGFARAAEYYYVDWLQADVAQGSASGTISLPDGSTVQVGFAALNPDGTRGNLYGAQTNGGTNYWNPAAPYMSEEVSNPPPGTDLLQLSGGQNQIYKVTLSEPIKDPIMAIVSLGQSSVTTTYDFDSPFTIVSQGPGYWGGTAMALLALPNDILRGNEGHGTIRFIGTFAAFSWTVPTPESWHGFTFGIRTTERIEPTPDAGAADAGADAVDASADAGDATTDASADAADTRADAMGAEDAAEEGAAERADAEAVASDQDETDTGSKDEVDQSESEDEDEQEDAGLEVTTSTVHTGIEERREGGCACSTTASWPSPGAALPALMLLGAGLLRRRRRD